MKLKEGTEELNYGRHIIRDWGAESVFAAADARQASGADSADEDSPRVFRILDLGCGHATDLLNIRDAAEGHPRFLDLHTDVELHGIENFEDYIIECREKGIHIHSIDIERSHYPAPDGFYDLVMANQLLEHTKEVFWIFAEVARILKPGGRFIAGVPNLASLHNRLLLLFGQQPTAQQTYSAHVRGFTKPDFRLFAEKGDFFRLLDFKGSNFYPFGKSIAMPLARMFPTLAWGSFYMLERTARTGTFLECLTGDDNFLETPFYGSPQNPAPPPPRRAAAKKKTAGKKAAARKTPAKKAAKRK